jgi:hypothetical protein
LSPAGLTPTANASAATKKRSAPLGPLRFDLRLFSDFPVALALDTRDIFHTLGHPRAGQIDIALAEQGKQLRAVFGMR